MAHAMASWRESAQVKEAMRSPYGLSVSMEVAMVIAIKKVS